MNNQWKSEIKYRALCTIANEQCTTRSLRDGKMSWMSPFRCQINEVIKDVGHGHCVRNDAYIPIPYEITSLFQSTRWSKFRFAHKINRNNKVPIIQDCSPLIAYSESKEKSISFNLLDLLNITTIDEAAKDVFDCTYNSTTLFSVRAYHMYNMAQFCTIQLNKDNTFRVNWLGNFNKDAIDRMMNQLIGETCGSYSNDGFVHLEKEYDRGESENRYRDKVNNHIFDNIEKFRKIMLSVGYLIENNSLNLQNLIQQWKYLSETYCQEQVRELKYEIDKKLKIEWGGDPFLCLALPDSFKEHCTKYESCMLENEKRKQRNRRLQKCEKTPTDD